MMPPNATQVKANARAQLRRGMFLLPSLFTVGNIAAGFFSIHPDHGGPDRLRQRAHPP
jgi:hypothetical protein